MRLHVREKTSATLSPHDKKSGTFSLSFSKSVSEKIRSLGFQWVKLEVIDTGLKLKFSREEKEGLLKLYWFSRGDCKIYIPKKTAQKIGMPIFSFPLAPIEKRRARVSFRGDEAFLIFKEILSPPKEIIEPKTQPIDWCRLEFNLGYRWGYLVFGPKISKILKEKGVKGVVPFLKKPFFVFIPESECFFECKDCQRIDCQRLSFHRYYKNYHIAKVSVYSFLKKIFATDIPLEERKGEVWFENNQIIVKLPILEKAPI